MTTNNPDLDPTDPYGVRCMLATGFAFYWEYRLTGNRLKTLAAAGCVENALHRWLLPDQWGQGINMDNLDMIMSLTPAALDMDSRDRKPDIAWERIITLSRMDAPTEHPQPSVQPDTVNRLKPPLARILRHWWLARLHERNHRYDPCFDQDNLTCELQTVAGILDMRTPDLTRDETDRLVRLIPKVIDPHSTETSWTRLRELLGENA